jgi:monovalent cation/proton antiporter MnhG/PhaG subunit
MIGSLLGIAGSAALLLGLTLVSIALYGMFRRSSIFEQLHAAGLATGSGVILVLVAALATGSAEIATSAALVVVFILVTSSLSTHAIAFAAWRLGAASGPSGGQVEDQQPAGDALPAAPPSLEMRVVLAHDGSSGADVATSLVGSLPWPEGSVIRVIGVIEGDLELRSPADAGREPAAKPPADLVGALQAAVGMLQRPGVAVDHVVRDGDPAAAFSDEAQAFGAHLVVIGSRGLGPVRALLVGSVAAAVVDAAPCSVLVARTPTLHHALLATDGSVPSDVATDAIIRWPVFEDVGIRVLSVAAATPGYWHPMRRGRARLHHQGIADAAALRLIRAGREALPDVRQGDAAAQIVSYANDRAIDVIVIGSSRHTGLTRTLLGSVGRAVLSSATRSVLVVRAAPRD